MTILSTLAFAMLATPAAFHVDVVAPGADKPKMILIPGLQSAGAVWNSTVDHFKDRYECHVLTLAGFAGQPALPEGAPMLETVRDQIAAYIREKHIKQPVIIGHSMGGFLALWLAARQPDITGPAVVVDSLPFLPAAYVPGATVNSVKSQAEAMKAMMSGMQGEAWNKYQKNNPSLAMMISSDSDRAIAVEWGTRSEPRAVAQAMFELFQADLRPELAQVRVPSLILAALKGLPDGSIKTYETQFERLKDARIVPFPESRHFIMFDAPDKMFQVIDDFLKGLK